MSVGDAQHGEMSRLSFPVDARNGSTVTLRAAAPSNAAEQISAISSPARVATTPHTYAPTAVHPVKTSRYTDNPRARTHRGNTSCASAFNVVNVISQAIPDNTKTGVAAANGSQATASGAQPYTAAPTASSALADTFWRTCAAITTASTAPKPISPSATP